MHTKGYEAHLLQSVYLQHHCHREEWGQYLIFWNNIFFAYGYADPGIQNNSNRNEKDSRLKIYRDVGNDNFAIKSVKYTNITSLISRYPYLHWKSRIPC